MNRRTLAIAGGACVAALVVWYLALWSPKGKELEEATQRKDAAEQEVEQLEIKLAQLQDAQKHAPEILATADRLRAAVPETADLAQFLLDANDVANASGVEYLSVAPTPPGPPKAAGLPSEIAVTLVIKAGYAEMLDFVDRLYAMRRVILIDGINIAVEGGGDNPFLNLNIAGRVFTTATSAAEVPAAAPATDPSAPAPTGTEVAAPASVAGGNR